MKLGVQVGLGPGHIALDGEAATPHPRGHSSCPHFRPISSCCGQMAGWMKIFGMKVGLDPSDIVLDGDPATPPKKGAEPL